MGRAPVLWRALFAAILPIILMGGSVATAAAATAKTTRASLNSAGAQNNGQCVFPSISADGRYVAFRSYATNLVANDTNQWGDIFVRDRTKGTTTRVSVGPGGVQTNGGDSDRPSISADGRYVAFESYASNLVAGDTNGIPGDYLSGSDIFVHDRTTGVTTRVSVSSEGVEGNSWSHYPSISADGRYVAFSSAASNLVAGDTNGKSDVFVHDRTTGATARVSVSSSGVQGDESSGMNTAISADGRYVAFDSVASNLVAGDTNRESDIFVHDRMTGSTTRVSVDSRGNQTSSGAPADQYPNPNSYDPSISADGRYVAFQSWAPNLVSGDTNRESDIFVHDRMTGVTTRVSVDSSGKQAVSGPPPEDYDEIGSFYPSISADGRYMAFYSWALNLVSGDTNGKSAPEKGRDVFVHDRITKTTTRASVNSAGKQSNGNSHHPSISANGRYVAFDSAASNLVTGDTNKTQDIFVRDRGSAPKTTLALTSKSNAKLGYGKTFKITGTLKSGSTAVKDKRQVVLQSAAPGKAFKSTSLKATTNAKGVFTFSVKPKAKTRYRVRFTGAVDLPAGGPTKVVTATPKVRVGTPVAPKTMKRSKPYTVYGSLEPKHTKGKKPVRIYKYQKVGKRWVRRGYITAKAYDYKTYTRYKAKVKLPAKGTWRLRSYAPADSKHAATWSSTYDTVKVK